jgi:SAM-dependent methyltransferase
VDAPAANRYYEDYYRPAETDEAAERSRLWRELSAVGKADHVQRLVERVGISAPGTVAEVGCGDGAVLGELGRRKFGERRVGLEVSSSGVELARQRPEIDETVIYDGQTIPAGDGAFDLVFATHVLEHLADPAPLLQEMARVALVVIVEVPLESNISGRRPAARAASDGVGHLQCFDRDQVRALLDGAGLRLQAEVLDSLPLAVQTFWSSSRRARASGAAKWGVRRAAAHVPSLATRLFTMHYAVLATRR